jgi:flagellar basal-body rod protein FlgF
MIRGLYSAATALQDRPGYRRQVLAAATFEQELPAGAAEQPGAAPLGTRAGAVSSVFEAGSYLHTGNPLDVAVRGDAFLVLQGPDGPVYTRDGVLQLTPDGNLQSATGLPVSSGQGKLTIPAGTRQITIGQDGTVSADRAVIGRIQLARFADPSRLRPLNAALFEAPPGVASESNTGTLLQGYRESSNVHVVNEMVSMIAGLRHYEAAQRALRALGDAVANNTRGQGG